MESSQSEAPISSERLPSLRLAVQNCRVSFPAQVPVFRRQNRPDAQWRIAALYLVQGWSLERIAHRYGVTGRRIGQTIRTWVERAAALGYLQRIPPEVHIAAGAVRSLPAASPIHTGALPLPPAAILQPHFLQSRNTHHATT